MVVVVVGDLVLGFVLRGETVEGGGDVGCMMVDDGVISAVCGWRWCLMVVGAVFCSVWTASGGVSSGVGCRRAGVDLYVSLIEVAGWPSPVEAASCFQSPSCIVESLVAFCGRLARPELSPSRRAFFRMHHENMPI